VDAPVRPGECGADALPLGQDHEGAAAAERHDDGLVRARGRERLQRAEGPVGGEGSSPARGAAGGDLVNISSVAGRAAHAGGAVYHATKWGLNGWSEALRQELQPDARVIVIEPGAAATELVDHITHGETKQGVEQFYEATAISADDVAQIIAFAVSRPRSVSVNEILVRPMAQSL
jgi:NAD(P)-dependent dehydrogenase (short-subunit alcohol dehydrogenase family)